MAVNAIPIDVWERIAYETDVGGWFNLTQVCKKLSALAQGKRRLRIIRRVTPRHIKTQFGETYCDERGVQIASYEMGSLWFYSRSFFH